MYFYSEIDARWKMLYYHLMFHSGFAFVLADDMYEKNIIRLIWIDYCSAKFENDLHRSVECLSHLEYLIEKQEPNFKIEFPNLKDGRFVDLESVRNTRINLQRFGALKFCLFFVYVLDLSLQLGRIWESALSQYVPLQTNQLEQRQKSLRQSRLREFDRNPQGQHGQ